MKNYQLSILNFQLKKIKEPRPEDVQWRKLGEVVEYEQPTKYIVSSKEYKDEYPTPVFNRWANIHFGVYS